MARRLGVNIDHIATIRNARGGMEPDPLAAMYAVAENGGDGITVHLREDRRHIVDKDVFRIKKNIPITLNLEMSIAEDIVKVALEVLPDQVTLVPEKREELTTEGGLDVFATCDRVKEVVMRLKDKGVIVSLFIEADKDVISQAKEVGADFIEIHTGSYANAKGEAQLKELEKIRSGASHAVSLGLGLNAGHGLNYYNVLPVAKIPGMDELNIGHSIIARAVFTGLPIAVSKMKKLIIGHER